MKTSALIKMAIPGMVIAFLLSLGGYHVASFHSLLDGFFVAFIGGIIVGNLVRHKTWLWAGTALCKDLLIPIGLFLYGTQINWLKWKTLEPKIFFMSLLNLFLYFVIIFFCNRFLFKNENNKVSYLNAGANAVCGVSATAVYIPFVDAKEDETTATLLAIVVTGLISVFATWYIISPAFGLSTNAYAMLCGLTLNQTGAVKAAAAFAGAEAVKIATQIKFFRTSLILPASFLLMFLSQAAGGKSEPMSKELRNSAIRYGLFIGALFFGASILTTFGPLGAHAKTIKPLFKVLFGMTLASVGLLCDVRKVLRKDIVFNILSP